MAAVRRCLRRGQCGAPRARAQVDPIVASFCGGSVGVLSALLVVEISNIRKQQRNRCAGAASALLLWAARAAAVCGRVVRGPPPPTLPKGYAG